MRSQKGVTLVSLIIYVIGMAIIIGILATITTFFYKNVQDANADIDPITEYTNFNSYFSDEVNHKNLKVIKCGTNEKSNQNYILFSNGVQFTYVAENKGIYRNKVKICRNIDNCIFEEIIENGKSIVTVKFKSGSLERETTYTLTRQ